MTRLIELINDRVSRYLAKSDVINATPAIVQSVENDNWATVQILCNDSVYRLRNLSGANVEVGDACQVYYKKALTQSNAYIGAAQPKAQSGSMQIISFETTNRLGLKSGEKYKIAEVSFVCHSLDKCYFSFSSSIKGTNNNDITLYLYIDDVEMGTTFVQSLTTDNSENISFYLPIEILNTGKHTITIKGSGQCNVLSVASYVYGFDLTEPESRLPDEYQEVEFLESTGTQYINTGFQFERNWIYEVDCEINNESGNQMFGMKYWYNHAIFVDSGHYYAKGDRYDTANGIDTGISAGTRSVIKFSYPDKSCYITTENDSWSHIFSSITPTSSVYPIALGAYWSYWTDLLDGYGKGKIYGFKFWEDSEDNLLSQMIPCIRKSDNKPGMYDIVRERFFTNAGTGEFITP